MGSIRNNCDQKFGHITIAFKLDRSSGSSLHLPETVTSPDGRRSQNHTRTFKSTIELPETVVVAYASDIKPGETRQFKTVTPVSTNTTYRFDSIKAF